MGTDTDHMSETKSATSSASPQQDALPPQNKNYWYPLHFSKLLGQLLVHGLEKLAHGRALGHRDRSPVPGPVVVAVGDFQRLGLDGRLLRKPLALQLLAQRLLLPLPLPVGEKVGAHRRVLAKPTRARGSRRGRSSGAHLRSNIINLRPISLLLFLFLLLIVSKGQLEFPFLFCSLRLLFVPLL